MMFAIIQTPRVPGVIATKLNSCGFPVSTASARSFFMVAVALRAVGLRLLCCPGIKNEEGLAYLYSTGGYAGHALSTPSFSWKSMVCKMEMGPGVPLDLF